MLRLAGLAYELPVGRGKALSIENSFLNAIAGGWSASGLFTTQTGQALVLLVLVGQVDLRELVAGQSAARPVEGKPDIGD